MLSEEILEQENKDEEKGRPRGQVCRRKGSCTRESPECINDKKSLFTQKRGSYLNAGREVKKIRD